MLSIIFLILKIVGIIFLFVIAFFLLLIVSVLFVPLRYHSTGYYRQEYVVKANISWLMHIITIKLMAKSKENLLLDIKLFGFTIWSNHKRISNQRKKKKKKTNRNIESEIERETFDQEIKPITPYNKKIESLQNTMTDTEHTERVSDETIEEKSLPKRKKGKKRLFFSIRAQFIRMNTFVKKITVNIKYSFSRFCDKIIHIKNNISYYYEIIQSDAFKNSFEKCKKRLLKMINDIRPTRFRLNIRFAKSDQPELVGQVMGVWGMLYPLHHGKVQLETSFEEDYFDADYEIKGHILGCVYIKTMLICFFDRDFKELRHYFSREDS